MREEGRALPGPAKGRALDRLSLEPIREVRSRSEGFAAQRLGMKRRPCRRGVCSPGTGGIVAGNALDGREAPQRQAQQSPGTIAALHVALF